MMTFFKKSLALVLFSSLTWAATNTDLRIVSVGGGATETIAALGGEKYLVGVDTSSTWPVEVTKLPQVGYQRTLAPEGILALKPTLLVGTSHTGPMPTLEHLEGAGVKVVILPSAPNLSTVKERIEEVAALLNDSAAGDQLWNKVQQDIATAQQKQQGIKKTKKVIFLLAVPGRPPMVAGKDTEADAMITLAGAENAVTDFDDYRVLTPEVLGGLNPDVILVTSNGLTAIGGQDKIWQLPGIKHTLAAKNHALISMEDGLLLNFGPRTGEALIMLTDELYHNGQS